MCASAKYSLVYFLSLQPHTFFFFRLRALVCFGVCLQSVCSLLCCSVRDCRGYFIKVHLLACLRPNHPPSKSHLHQTLGILWPFLLLTLGSKNMLVGGRCLFYQTDSHQNHQCRDKSWYDLSRNSYFTHTRMRFLSSLWLWLTNCKSEAYVSGDQENRSSSVRVTGKWYVHLSAFWRLTHIWLSKSVSK